VNRVLPPNADGQFLEHRKERETEYLEAIGREFQQFPIFQVPLMPSDVVGADTLGRLADTYLGVAERR